MSTVHKDPLKTFRFLVEAEKGGTKGGAVVAAFSQFSGIKVNVETVETRPGSDPRGVKETIPVLTSFSPVTLTKGVIGDNDFIEWLFNSVAGIDRGIKSENLYRTINVIALNDEGKRGVSWSLKDALPIGYELTPMDSARSEVLSESLTFAIAGVKRTVLQS
ncbi:MAG: phage tail protein [Oscillibacter sp.]|nr:phage tail protein [Oscillibacter sp.]